MNKLKKYVALFIATGGYSGFLWPAPGTWGSLASILVFLRWPGLLTAEVLLWGIVVMFILGMMSIPSAERALGSRRDYRPEKSRNRDQQQIVIDEFLGQWIALLPFIFWPEEVSRTALSIALFLFRTMDILKPYPITHVDKGEKFENSFGVLLDDVLAGVYAAAVLAIHFWIVRLF